jgi:hypothetical protein
MLTYLGYALLAYAGYRFFAGRTEASPATPALPAPAIVPMDKQSSKLQAVGALISVQKHLLDLGVEKSKVNEITQLIAPLLLNEKESVA